MSITGYSDPIRTLRMVRVTGFEPAASCSQSRRATICATPGYLVFIRLGVFSQSSRVIAAAAPRHFAALRLLLRRGQPYQYNGLQGESQPAPAATPPCEKQNPPPAAMECLAALCFTLFLYNFFMKKPNGFYKYHTEQ